MRVLLLLVSMPCGEVIGSDTLDTSLTINLGLMPIRAEVESWVLLLSFLVRFYGKLGCLFSFFMRSLIVIKLNG